MVKQQKPRPLAAGNWKMNGLKSSLSEIEKLVAYAGTVGDMACDILVCPPATLVMAAAGTAKGSAVAIGAQDCHAAISGAHTGDVSPEMLKDAGCSYVIVGHSERRADHGEQNADVNAKAGAALRAGLTPIICVGETEAERDQGKTLAVVDQQTKLSIPQAAQADAIVIAYEPVWAIGTGRTPTLDEVVEVHGAIRKILLERFGAEGNGVRILYGGSVKPSNAVELMAVDNVNGALVGGASLKADDFQGIIAAF